ncbi:hypothetical protein AZE42_07091 [Rhizopogon vesiculosus]|uniref:Uncharacterized protein n=1 Tax=Rhizopogon vesiculosus TaxID=180088 RepID=A0A1J8QH32_9AGAM|nr:hypothetical protein AZE42_07091 [Rhizopogon vesiculosus]
MDTADNRSNFCVREHFELYPELKDDFVDKRSRSFNEGLSDENDQNAPPLRVLASRSFLSILDPL